MVYPGSTTQRIEEMKNKQKNSEEDKVSKHFLDKIYCQM